MPQQPSMPRADLEQSVLDAGRRVGQAAVLYHSRVAAHFGLGATDMKALDLIQSHGPLTPADLAGRLGFTPASVTAMLDRLEAKRLLRRVPHPSDGRRRLVGFDPEAMARLQPVYAPFFTSLHEMLAAYTDVELAVIGRAFRDVADRQFTAAAELPDSPTPAAGPLARHPVSTPQGEEPP